MFIAGCGCLLTWEVATITPGPQGQTGDGPNDNIPERAEPKTTVLREPPSQGWQEAQNRGGEPSSIQRFTLRHQHSLHSRKHGGRKQHSLALCVESPAKVMPFWTSQMCRSGQTEGGARRCRRPEDEVRSLLGFRSKGENSWVRFLWSGPKCIATFLVRFGSFHIAIFVRVPQFDNKPPM